MKKLTIFCLSVLFILTACGNKADKVSNKEDVSFGEMMNNGTKFFFIVDSDGESIGKDDQVHTVIKSQDGKITTYNLSNTPVFDDEKMNDLSLGEVSKMSDKEIEKKARKGHKLTMDNIGVYSLALSNYIKNENISTFDVLTDDTNFVTRKNEIGKHTIDDQTKEFSQNDYNKSMKYVEKAKKENIFKETTQPYKLNIKVESDDSGNQTSKERFNIDPAGNGRINDFNYTDAETKDDVINILSRNYKLPKNNYLSFNGGSIKKIYDTNFGYMIESNDSDDDMDTPKTKLVTKVGKKVNNVVNDKPDSKYVKEDN